jgi:hypothetical protein
VQNLENDDECIDFGGLVCVECRTRAPILYLLEGCLTCVECCEAHFRRERFKNEEREFNSQKRDVL